MNIITNRNAYASVRRMHSTWKAEEKKQQKKKPREEPVSMYKAYPICARAVLHYNST